MQFTLFSVQSNVANKKNTIQHVNAATFTDAALMFMSKLFCSNKSPKITATLTIKNPNGAFKKLSVVRARVDTPDYKYVHFIKN